MVRNIANDENMSAKVLRSKKDLLFHFKWWHKAFPSIVGYIIHSSYFGKTPLNVVVVKNLMIAVLKTGRPTDKDFIGSEGDRLCVSHKRGATYKAANDQHRWKIAIFLHLTAL
jgi:hypothetical protein